MEDRAGMSAAGRFSLAIRHAVHGHLPYQRYHAAGLRRKKAGAGEAWVGRSVAEWLETDLNPAIQVLRCVGSLANAAWGYNVYNKAAGLGVRTQVNSLEDLRVQRVMVATESDPELCRLGTVAVFEHMVRCIARNTTAIAAPRPKRMVDMALRLGIERTAAAEVAAVFEIEGAMTMNMLARRLGCSLRTLQRHLRADGVSAEEIRMAARLGRATARLRSYDSLTHIAIDEGFSDLAHMSRAFRYAAGMSPTQLRQALHGPVEPDPWVGVV